MVPTDEEAREVIEVEAERMPLEDEARTRETASKLKRSMGPVLAGIIIDAVDFTMILPTLGLVVGAPVGYWLARRLGFSLQQSLIAGVACGVYCMFPPTNFFPLATILGALAPVFIPDRNQEAPDRAA